MINFSHWIQGKQLDLSLHFKPKSIDERDQVFVVWFSQICLDIQSHLGIIALD